ncbi:MAG: ImmA/IrrE family metallo-endopeptidase [Thermoleophilaceae bacterium]
MATYWTNESVLAFAGDRDPVDAVEEAAREVVFEAVENGWEGPPFDPFELARLLGLEVVPKDEFRDARTVPVGGGEVAIEYNPTRPRHRLRFSIAHEIAHTLFPDVAKIARYRANPAGGPPDGWQLELLCNVAAAEFLMPTDTLPMLREGPLEIEELMDLRAGFGVSTEVLLRRATKLASYPVAMFAASRTEPSAARSPFRIDYTVPSRAWAPSLERGRHRPADSVLSECTAVGFTAKRQEDWSDELRGLAVQAVGTPPFPGQRFPRVLGLLHPRGVRRVADVELVLVHGDATAPRGAGPLMIVHLVNDRTPNWGGAFARALRERHPAAQEDFRAWVNEDRTRLRLGAAFVSEVDDDLYVATIVGQHGYGRSARPRIRYAAVRQALGTVARFASDSAVSVHMPRIGAGQAGGRWPLIREIVEETLTRRGLPVTVYVPPGQPIREESQPREELTLDV